jgi:hypothetical protein
VLIARRVHVYLADRTNAATGRDRFTATLAQIALDLNFRPTYPQTYSQFVKSAERGKFIKQSLHDAPVFATLYLQ